MSTVDADRLHRVPTLRELAEMPIYGQKSTNSEKLVDRSSWPDFPGLYLLEYPTQIGKVARLGHAALTGNRPLPRKKRQRKKCRKHNSMGPHFGNAILASDGHYLISRATYVALVTFLPDIALMYPDTPCILCTKDTGRDERQIMILFINRGTGDITEMTVKPLMRRPSSFELKITNGARITVTSVRPFPKPKTKE